jgi:thiamine-phosphate pyrophosphorylase
MKPSLTNARLYGILDLSYVNVGDSFRALEAMLKGGVDLIQLRGKEKSMDELAGIAAKIHEITSQSSIPLIVNDYAEIAARVPVEGVHVGQDDDSVASVREKAGRKLFVGKSTHSLEQAMAAQREGADYIGFGPIFATPTKPGYRPIGTKGIRQVHVDVTLPIFCIGGIKLENLPEVIADGAGRVAIVSGLLKAPDITQYAGACKKLLTSDLRSPTSDL